MSQTLPALVTEAAALSVAGAGLRQYEMGTAVIGAGADATVVIVESGDNPRVSGVQDSSKVLLCGDPIPDLRSRFGFEGALGRGGSLGSRYLTAVPRDPNGGAMERHVLDRSWPVMTRRP